MKLKTKIVPNNKEKKFYPLLPVREKILFPGTSTSIFIGREGSIVALERALERNKVILLAFQKNPQIESPTKNDFYTVGTLCYISKFMKLPDKTVQVVMQGVKRGEIISINQDKTDIFTAGFLEIKNTYVENNLTSNVQSLISAVKEQVVLLGKRQRKFPKEVLASLNNESNPDTLIGSICLHFKLPRNKQVEYLMIKDTEARLENLAVTLGLELEILQIKEDISGKVKEKIDKGQKEYVLNEQLKEIQKELGGEEYEDDLKERLLVKNLPEHVSLRAQKELKRLNSLQSIAPESGIIRGYLEWIEELPWLEQTSNKYDILHAESVLNSNHYGLQEIKERILDFLTVYAVNNNVKGPILCFVGPPGIGKTSLGSSIAKALGRVFVRIALGGLRDEAEIRGHRRTYVGALPGKIVNALKQAQVNNPVMLLDEIDKLSSDYRGDPSSALLEVLDPEQNNFFVDHYLEIPFDLSKIIFITTANSIEKIPYPLLDRMEVVHIPGYTIYEKEKITTEHLIKKQLEENGLEQVTINFSQDAIKLIIEEYTMESGVRSLERHVSKIIRKSLRREFKKAIARPGVYAKNSACLHENQSLFSIDYNDDRMDAIFHNYKWDIDIDKVKKYLGKPRYDFMNILEEQRIGLAVGMAWTEYGGRVLPVEVITIKGATSGLTLTGKLGDVMQESAKIAYSLIQTVAEPYRIPHSLLEKTSLHVHIPEGAIPKDGPSAGITMVVAMISAITSVTVKSFTAMTGEITLTDRILPVGGVKEKVLAAHRNHIKQVILPSKNQYDYDDIPDEVKNEIELKFVSRVEEALEILLDRRLILDWKNSLTLDTVEK